MTRTDGLGRVREVKTNNKNGEVSQLLKWQIGYDPLGNIATFADGKGNLRNYVYDSLARLTALTDPNMGQVAYEYNDLGQVTLRRDALGQEQRNAYGMAGRLASVTYANAANGRAPETFAFHYDVEAENTPLVNASNLMGALAWVEGPYVNDHFSYDELGRQTQHGVELWDGKSPFSAQVRNHYLEQASYDAAGEVTSRTLPGGMAANFEYNQRGLLGRVNAGLSGDTRTLLDNASYDALGLPLSEEHGNGTRSCQSYDQRKRIVGSIVGRTADTHCSDIGIPSKGYQQLAWTWTHDGMLKQLQDLSVVSEGVARLDADYRYDRVNQLISADIKAVGIQSFEYDEIQNLTHHHTVATGHPEVDQILQYGSTGGSGPNRVVRAGQTDLEYDGVGDLRRYNGFELSFDVAGQLVQATKTGEKTLRYYYDAAGDRRLMLVERAGEAPEIYAYPIAGYEIRNGDEHWKLSAGAATAEVTRAEGLRVDAFLLDELTTYVASPEGKQKPLPQEFMDLNGDGHGFDSADLALAQQGLWNETPVGGARTIWRYFHSDQLASTLTVTDSIGDVVSSMRYHPYGETAERHGQLPSRGYTGAESEPDQDLGIIRMGARYYAPALGRWITPDQYIGESPKRMAETPFESGLFSYASNNPIVFKDPLGRQATPVAAGRPPPNLSQEEAQKWMAARDAQNAKAEQERKTWDTIKIAAGATAAVALVTWAVVKRDPRTLEQAGRQAAPLGQRIAQQAARFKESASQLASRLAEFVRGPAAPGAKDIALGTQKSGAAEWAASRGVAYFKDWKALGLYDSNVRGWGEAFHQAMGRTIAGGGKVHFELADLNVAEALAGDSSMWVGRYTAWELQQVVANPAYRAATTFYMKGVEMKAGALKALGL